MRLESDRRYCFSADPDQVWDALRCVDDYRSWWPWLDELDTTHAATTGTAGTGQAGTGRAGTGTARTGRAGTGQAGTGKAGTGQAGTGQAGTGKAGTGQAGTGQAGTGKAGTGQAGTGQAAAGALAPGMVWRCSVRSPIQIVLRFTITLEVVTDPSHIAASVTGDLVGPASLRILPRPAGGSEIRLTSALAPRSTTLGLLMGVAPPLAKWAHDHLLDTAARQFEQAVAARGDQGR